MNQFSDNPDYLPSTARILVITGMSGAGKTSTLKLLEDIGFEAVDNVPISLMRDLVGTRRRSSQPRHGWVTHRTRA
ncbi:MAG: RNase adapter RapZ, partial [Alphaproteobacteria bacterium]